MRLATACTTCAPSSADRRFSSSPSSISGDKWPTAAAMFCRTGSTRSGAFFDTTSMMPRSIRRTAAVFAPMPPPVSILPSTVDIRSHSWSALPARLIRSLIAASSSSNALPCRQFVTTRSQTAVLAAGPLAQHLRVVDFPQLQVAAGHGRPDASDPAVGSDRFRRSPEQQQEHPPRFDVAARVDRELSDQMTVEESRQLGERALRPGRGPLVEEQVRPAAR